MYRKILINFTIGVLLAMLIAIVVFVYLLFNDVGVKTNTQIVYGKVITKTTFNPNIKSTTDRKLTITFKVGDEVVKLDCDSTRYYTTKVGDMVKLKRTIYRPTIGNTETYFDYVQ